MLKLKDNVNIGELEKFGFTILIDDELFEKQLEEDPKNFYCTRAFKNLGNHYTILIENDHCENQITIVPEQDYTLRWILTWQLETLYDLIQAGLIERMGES
ncbi:MAG: hypothetical protein J6T10_25130 [Methanobrevibacter sp.]|nr:hypothetical protein [Methanobrevibacter sp.]